MTGADATWAMQRAGEILIGRCEVHSKQEQVGGMAIGCITLGMDQDSSATWLRLYVPRRCARNLAVCP
jgi:hypothetical protein